MIDSVVILQPPLVQLNGPYPSGAYLSAFFARLAADGRPAPAVVRWVDAGNLFFHELFSRDGLDLLFSLCREEALAKALAAASSGDEETAFQLRRYVSLEPAWKGWIDGIVSILCTGDRELCHSFIRSPFAPRGARMDSFLSSLDGDPTADDARMLSTLALEDLADFISAVFDPEFSLVRYAESIAAGESRFANVEAALDRPLVRHFLEPFCLDLWDRLSAELPSSGKILFCVSVPFPGCLVNALAMARSLRGRYGDRAVVSMGGGYVNTELRGDVNERLFSYVDTLSFDRGYGGYAWILEQFAVCGDDFAPLPKRLFCPDSMAGYEKTLTMTLVPDYGDIDFAKYPRLADDPNPMHRLWSDGAWLKAYLAHGCYWHRCSFCDVSLDYIAVYLPVGIQKLYAGLRAQALGKGVRGIHLIDEAAPPRALRDFAYENLKASSGSSLIPFWGNIRFERTFSRDLADFLSAGGLSAVSGGIEIASPSGFKAVDKGIDLENLVAVCAAFKEAGILVHAYLIYGYWSEDAQGIIDAAEVMRQLFAAGLVDSAFWHKFVLTRHSRVYCEYQKGMHRGDGRNALRPIEAATDFAANDLRFSGEKESSAYTAGLDAALESWMAGEALEKPVRSWFAFPMPAPGIQKNLIDSYIESYERSRDHERNRPCDAASRYYWAGSVPVRVGGDLVWWYMGEEVRLSVAVELEPCVLKALVPRPDLVYADTAALCALPRSVFRALRQRGLCRASLR